MDIGFVQVYCNGIALTNKNFNKAFSKKIAVKFDIHCHAIFEVQSKISMYCGLADVRVLGDAVQDYDREVLSCDIQMTELKP